MIITIIGIDLWLLNKKNQTTFDILNPMKYSEICIQIHNIWTRKILHYISLSNHINKDPKCFNIFNKIRYNIDESSGNIYMDKIIKYI